jgi:hypothetical protein
MLALVFSARTVQVQRPTPTAIRRAVYITPRPLSNSARRGKTCGIRRSSALFGAARVAISSSFPSQTSRSPTHFRAAKRGKIRQRADDPLSSRLPRVTFK